MSYYEKAVALRAEIDAAGTMLTDEQAVQVKGIYKAWAELIGTAATVGQKFRHEDALYKVIQAHTFAEQWVPGVGTESMYAKIDDSHAGTLNDPIPYEGNMALEQGKYYSQDGVTYVCIRDTINPVHHALSDLVGLYVEVV